ncbi:hypothetical protein OH76DRAFT_154334 [Lentinus brumalis]|uniref:Uncharacterized protein n=1 Tax=Lentinus brumalis TaxID=2498619 RepID=A0A371CP16_9APHY|nr:hypothetical protein OH76DRAFT_154334 [Polyporus brumalis]
MGCFRRSRPQTVPSGGEHLSSSGKTSEDHLSLRRRKVSSKGTGGARLSQERESDFATYMCCIGHDTRSKSLHRRTGLTYLRCQSTYN